MEDLSEEHQALYTWIDEIPLTRQKKHVARDFSDGVMAAEVVHHFLPKLVELHNYSPANSVSQKLENWRTLNRKVFSRLNFNLPDDIIQGVVASKPGVIEFILTNLRNKIERYLQNRTMRKNMMQEQGYLSDGYHTQEEAYGGTVYNPEQLPSNYGTGGSLVYNHQELLRHPGPVHPPGRQELLRHPGPVHPPGRQGGEGQPPHLTLAGGFSVHQPNSTNPPPLAHTHSYPSHTPHVSKFPPPNHNQPIKNHTVTGAEDYSNFTLPPLNLGQRLAMSDQQKRSNPERRSKLPTLDNRKHNYASNPHSQSRTAVLPHGHTKQRADSTGQKIRLAEKDQRILESHEYIQLLQMKVTRLEHLVQIKDMRITELSRQLEMAKNPLQRR